MTAETGELAAGPGAALAHGRRGLITELLMNLTRHHSKLFSAGLREIDPATDWKARARTLYDLVFTGLKADPVPESERGCR